jgi:hypothetical protein
LFCFLLHINFICFSKKKMMGLRPKPQGLRVE